VDSEISEARMLNDERMTNKLNVIRYIGTLLHRISDSTIQRFNVAKP